ncbi:hypothetical protein FB451DRAFT_1418307 [Mycena latifolia]|nr:hypothetical protein FB451DRAFT_1418307 [Mycena latifolia]
MTGHAGAGKVRYSVSLTSQLIPRVSFASESSRAELVGALMGASGAPAPDEPLMIIQITAPTATGPTDVAPGRTSVTPSWYDVVYHAPAVRG